MENPSKDYSFNLNYFNTLDRGELELIQVKIINLPTYIRVNPFLEDIMNTKDLLFSGENRLSEINDSDWYTGNVLYIRPNCTDCPDKIQINNHINFEAETLLVPQLAEYKWNSQGGSVQTADSLLHLHHNGSTRQIASFPHLEKTVCNSLTTTTT